MIGRVSLSGEVLSAGAATGPLMLLDEPLSFWGGTDGGTGTIIDQHHPQHGRSVSGTILAMPASRGSSSSTTVLAEQLRRGVGPRGILLRHRDPVIGLAAVVCAELYGVCTPIVVLERTDFDALPRTGVVTIRTDRGAADIMIEEPAERPAAQ